MAPNQEPKLGDVTLTVKTESFSALPNDFGQLKLSPQVTLLLQPALFPMSSSCRHLSGATSLHPTGKQRSRHGKTFSLWE